MVALDYLSWSGDRKRQRQAALARYAASGVEIDGWSGSGRQRADAVVPVHVARSSGSAAVVTTRVRVTPYASTGQETGTSASAAKEGARVPSNVAVAPPPGDKPKPSRWLMVAVPVGQRQGGLVVTASPALVGSAPDSVPSPAVAGSASSDSATSQATRAAVTTLMRRYGSGELSYARASGAGFSGLNGAASLVELSSWEMAKPDPSRPNRRVGDVTVTWSLASGAGRLSSTYRITLVRQQGKWLLSDVAVTLKEGTS